VQLLCVHKGEASFANNYNEYPRVHHHEWWAKALLPSFCLTNPDLWEPRVSQNENIEGAAPTQY